MVEYEESMGFLGVSTDMVEAVWEQVEPLLADGLEYSDGELTTSDILKLVLDQSMQLWIIYRGSQTIMAATTEIINYPRKKICRVVVMAGESGDLWQQCTTSVEEWARSMECDSMEVMGRKGMVHKLKPVGYEQKYIVARKAL